MDGLTELVKEESPTLYVEDFLYYYNKAVSEYMKARYELFEITQQITDDLRFWKTEHVVTEEGPIDTDNFAPHYRHILSCVLNIKVVKPIFKCSQIPNTVEGYKCKRLTSDVKADIKNNEYLKPTFFRPYFDILNKSIIISAGDLSDNSIELSNITIEYLRQPGRYTLTAVEIENEDSDTSELLEFTRDVGDEIMKIMLKLVLERGSDQRLQTHIGVNQTINDPSIQR